MEHFRKHLQCLMAGSKIQVKIYIHFNIQFTFTSFKEYNPKIKSMTNKHTNKKTTNGCFCDCFYRILYFQNTYLHFTPFVQLQTVQTIYTLLQIMEFMTKFLTLFHSKTISTFLVKPETIICNYPFQYG